MRKTRVILTSISLGGGGAERIMSYLVRYLDKTRYEVAVVIFKNERSYLSASALEGVELYVLEKKGKLDFFRLILALRNIFLDFRPDAIVSFLYYTNIVAFIGWMLAGNRGRLILSERNYPPSYLANERFGLVKKRLLHAVYRKADVVAANSQQIKEALVQLFGLEPGRIAVVYNPIPTKEIKALAVKSVCHRFFTSENNQVIIGAGRLVTQKRFDRLLDCFGKVGSSHPNAHLIVLGEGGMRRELEAQRDRLGLTERVDFVGFQGNPYAWLSKADIFVLSSDYEGFPNVLLEAMACGTAVIAMNRPSGPAEILTDGENGMLVDSEQDLVVAMNTLLEDTIMREALSLKGRKRAEEFAVELVIPEFEQLISNSIGSTA